jgi:hypothetical protein
MPKSKGRSRRGLVNYSKGGGRPRHVDAPVVTESNELFDEDDFENYIDMGDDDGYWDEIFDDSTDYEGVADVDVEAVQHSISESEQRWRAVGFNTNRRGAGTSKSIFKRNKRKATENVKAAKGSSSMEIVYPKVIVGEIADQTEKGTDNTNEVETVDADEEISERVPEFDLYEEIALGLDVNLAADKLPRRNSREAIRPYALTMEQAINRLLENEAKVTRNLQIEKKKGLEHWMVIQATAILRYLFLLKEGKRKMEASTEVATALYQKSNMRSYKATLNRNWTHEYLVSGHLVKYKQGKFIKTSSIIFDEHVQQLFRSELRNMKDEDRTPKSFHNLLNDKPFAEIDNAPTKISLNTAYKWLLFLGFSPTVQLKRYYTDGHCREDVVKYRNEVFLPQMLSLERKMAEYSGDNMEIVSEPDLSENEKKCNCCT